MKTVDLIEQAESASEAVVSVDNTDELQRWFHNYAELQGEQ